MKPMIACLAALATLTAACNGGADGTDYGVEEGQSAKMAVVSSELEPTTSTTAVNRPDIDSLPQITVSPDSATDTGRHWEHPYYENVLTPSQKDFYSSAEAADAAEDVACGTSPRKALEGVTLDNQGIKIDLKIEMSCSYEEYGLVDGSVEFFHYRRLSVELEYGITQQLHDDAQAARGEAGVFEVTLPLLPNGATDFNTINIDYFVAQDEDFLERDLLVIETYLQLVVDHMSGVEEFTT